MTMVEVAKRLSKKAHETQVDKGGQSYYLHPETVASFVQTDEEKAVAYLHDVLEDTELTEEQLKEAGMSEAIIQAVKLLTWRDGSHTLII
ncbi:hypothetical protein IGI37_000228 [Enterococcus sp. AZ194]